MNYIEIKEYKNRIFMLKQVKNKEYSFNLTRIQEKIEEIEDENEDENEDEKTDSVIVNINRINNIIKREITGLTQLWKIMTQQVKLKQPVINYLDFDIVLSNNINEQIKIFEGRGVKATDLIIKQNTKLIKLTEEQEEQIDRCRMTKKQFSLKEKRLKKQRQQLKKQRQPKQNPPLEEPEVIIEESFDNFTDPFEPVISVDWLNALHEEEQIRIQLEYFEILEENGTKNYEDISSDIMYPETESECETESDID